MNRIDERFKELRRARQKAVIVFVTAGDPSLGVTRQALRHAEKSGVDLVELGVPFSDPLADGPVIQAASFRALKRGVTFSKILDLVRAERRAGLTLPLVLMTSFNPVHRYGPRRAFEAAQRAGADGFIIPDLPFHEASNLLREARRLGLRLILMLTPTTSPERKTRILRKAGGFLYYVSLTGVTGERRRSAYPFRRDVLRIRRRTRVPLCVGFGVSTPREAAEISRFADGVIVGSAVVRNLDAHSRAGLSLQSKRWIAAFARAVKGRVSR